MATVKRRIVYVTSNQFKRQENAAFMDVAVLSDGTRVKDCFEFAFRDVSVSEILEVDLSRMVVEEVTSAYSQIRVPCIVEHAGLIFSEYAADSYPGGLTKPMWNTLGEKFLEETHSAGRQAVARAVVAYCNGKAVKTYEGETEGSLSQEVRGNRTFYWDTVFVPDLDQNEPGHKLTYAEIADKPELGLRYKMNGLSQSARAMLSFLEAMKAGDDESLWH